MEGKRKKIHLISSVWFEEWNDKNVRRKLIQFYENLCNKLAKIRTLKYKALMKWRRMGSHRKEMKIQTHVCRGGVLFSLWEDLSRSSLIVFHISWQKSLIYAACLLVDMTVNYFSLISQTPIGWIMWYMPQSLSSLVVLQHFVFLDQIGS